MAKIFLLHRTQELPVSLEAAWKFFSSPDQLKVITPEYMGFNITSPYPSSTMYPGMIISYVVKPFMSIGIPWVTEITHVEEPQYFVDEQRFGPYKFWHHQHKFLKTEGGVLMEDIVHYALPFGFVGTVMHKLVVRQKLEEIFDYRRKKLIELFK